MSALASRAWFWGLVGFAVSMFVFFALAALGWPGSLDSCTQPGGNCYCESFGSLNQDIVVRQPANTWSGLFAVVFGLIILAVADRDRREGGSVPNPMREGAFYALMYGGLTVFLGPGAMFFHASMTKLGGWLDNLSMVLYVTFLLLYTVFRLFRWDGRVSNFVWTYVPLNIVLAAISWFVEGSGTFMFAIGAGLALLLEAGILLRIIKTLRREFWPWFAAALLAFGAGFAIWALSGTGGPLCDPSSLFQGHAVWHLLAMSLTPFLLFLYFRTETRAELSTEAGT
jgi:hypothetical protein